MILNTVMNHDTDYTLPPRKKHKGVLLALLLLLGLLASSLPFAQAAPKPRTFPDDLKISNAVTNTVGLTVQKSGTLTANLVEYRNGATLLGGVGTNGAPLHIDYGNLVTTTDGTNITFNRTFSTPPVVTFTRSIAVTNIMVVSAVTTSNATIAGCGSTNYVRWHAMGPP